MSDFSVLNNPNEVKRFEDSVMVALIPTTSDWCAIDLPHLTLVYAGKIPDLPPTAFNELAKVALDIAFQFSPIVVDVLGTDTFGGGSDDSPMVDVLLLRPIEPLLQMRMMLERWSASEHPFAPHVTVGPIGSGKDQTPDAIMFDRIMVAWGPEHLTYRLNLT